MLFNNDTIKEVANNITEEEILIENINKHKKRERKKKARIVLLILLLMVLIFILCSGWLIYNHTASSSLEGYEDVSCESSDHSCLELLCPQGSQYSETTDQCMVQQHYTCCTDRNNIFSCAPSQSCVQVTYEGVLYPGYKQYCREGWLWVPWKRKCLRQKAGIVEWAETD